MKSIQNHKSFAARAGLVKAWAAALVLGASAIASHAQVQTVFNAYTDVDGNFLSPTSFAFNCFTCDSPALNLREIGDIVTLAGTQRTLDSGLVMLGQFGVTGVPFNPYTANVTLSIYSVTNIGPTPSVSLLGSQTTAQQITTLGDVYDVPFNFAGMGIVMPNTIYYGVSVSSTSPSVAGLRLALYDYLDPFNYGTGAAGTRAPGSLAAGSDPGTVVNSLSPLNVSSVMYARTVNNPGQVVQTQPGVIGGPSINTGNTGAVMLTAVPEPQTYVLMALGIAAVLGAASKKRKT